MERITISVDGTKKLYMDGEFAVVVVPVRRRNFFFFLRFGEGRLLCTRCSLSFSSFGSL